MYRTEVFRRVQAPRAAVYRALVDADAIAAWRVPENMRSHVHTFDAREGGAFRVTITYGTPDEKGKSGGNADTYHGRFLRLITTSRWSRSSCSRRRTLPCAAP